MKRIYLDGAANTPLDPKVLKTMKPYLSPKHVGNSYAIHDFGIQNMCAIEGARSDIAQVMGVNSSNVFFTSGASESNNWVIKSVATHELFHARRKKLHMICGAAEHSSVINTCKAVEKWGVSVTYVAGTGEWGAVTKKDVEKVLRPDTCLVCVMAINNETGVANNVEEIAKLCKKNKTLTLIDCTQWLSKGGEDMNLTQNFPHGDFFSFSAHKIYGPTGVGCLITKKGSPNCLDPLIIGGSQESGKRGGTSNTASIVGMAQAVKLMRENDYTHHFDTLYTYLLRKKDKERLLDLNVVPTHTNILSLRIYDLQVSSDVASILASHGVAVSSGSACDTNHIGFNPSHVLKSLDMADDHIKKTIRVSFTKYTTTKDIDTLFKVIKEIKKEQARIKKNMTRLKRG